MQTERLCHTNFFSTNRINNLTATTTDAPEDNMKEKHYINTHFQMQIAVNISTDLVNLFVWHKQKFPRSTLTGFCKFCDFSTWNCHSDQLNQLTQMPLKTTWEEAHFFNTHVPWHLQQTTENFHWVWVKSLCDQNVLFARSSEIHCIHLYFENRPFYLVKVIYIGCIWLQ